MASEPGSTAGSSRTQSNQTWYRTPPANVDSSTPYEICHVSIQDDNHEFRTCHYVSFWPFTSPTDADISEGVWDDMEGVFAISATRRLIVGRVTDADGHQELWSYETGPEDAILHVEWSYNPITLRPILAAAGRSHMIYLFDYGQKAPFRILSGHGYEVLCLKFHPRLPHILASSSGDKTIRIWNVLGTDLPPVQPGELRSQNYPQGKADEGNVIVAVLAGERKGGHRSAVSSLAFHPRHNAIASGGFDRQVAIWRLPQLPDVSLEPIPTPRGYRPEIIFGPVFSTDTLHKEKLNSIDWLCPDVLISLSPAETTIWQWTRYSKYFDDEDPEKVETDSPHVPYGDEAHSQNYRVCADLQMPPEREFHRRFGFHQAFDPAEDEVDFATCDLVVDNLVAFPVEARTPRLRLLNPDLLVVQPRPLPSSGYRRPPTPDYYGEIPEPVPDAPGDEAMPIEIPGDGDSDDDGTGTNGLATQPDGHAVENDRDRAGQRGNHEDVNGRPSTATLSPASTEMDILPSRVTERSDSRPKGSGDRRYLPTSNGLTESMTSIPDPHARSDASWTLKIPGNIWISLIDQIQRRRREKAGSRAIKEMRDSKTVLRSVAISPRGGQWVVAVGEYETIAVWRLPTRPGREQVAPIAT